MPHYRVTATVDSAHGHQCWRVDAASPAEARVKYKKGEHVFESEEVEIVDLSSEVEVEEITAEEAAEVDAAIAAQDAKPEPPWVVWRTEGDGECHHFDTEWGVRGPMTEAVAKSYVITGRRPNPRVGYWYEAAPLMKPPQT